MYCQPMETYMANQAANFKQHMKRVWGDGPAPKHSTENANDEAIRYDATCVRAFMTKEYHDVPGDIAASLWRFRDGSEYVIADDGAMMHPAITSRRKYRERIVV